MSISADMPTVATEEDRKDSEIWELTIPGRVSLNVHLLGGVVRNLSRKGEGQRLRITTYDRKVAQEQIRDADNDPFGNGMLVRVDAAGAKAAKTPNQLNDDALADIFLLDDEDFGAAIDTLTQVNLRRLKSMTRKRKARQVQADAIDEMIAAKWPVGSDTPSNAEARGDTF